jgi:hypothetical protein
MWIVLLGYLALMLAFLPLQIFIEERVALPIMVSVALFSVLHLFALVGLALGIVWFIAPPSYRQARRDGVAATAQVLAYATTGWRRRRRPPGSLWGTSRIVSREYRLHAQINLPSAVPYETAFFAYLKTEPRPGAVLSVKVHPRRRDVVVLAAENEV